MASVSAQTRQTLTWISGLIQANLVNQASVEMTKLIGHLGPQELALASHDIRNLIGGFQKKRRRDLQQALEQRLGKVASAPSVNDGITVRSQLSPASSEHLLSTRVEAMLLQLANNHIFKWSPHYRDVVQFIVDSALSEFPRSGTIDVEVTLISERFAGHSKMIFERGYAFQIRRELTPAVAELKSISGLQAFLDVVVSVYLDKRQSVHSATEANILWRLTSGMLSGITGGYGAADLGGVAGWQLLAKNPRS